MATILILNDITKHLGIIPTETRLKGVLDQGWIIPNIEIV